MGVAAYNRGSKVISWNLRRAYDLERRDHQELIKRYEVLIQQFNQFSRDAQNLFHDAIDKETSKGSLRSLMYEKYQKKRNTLSFIKLMMRAQRAHNAWVDVDSRDTYAFLRVSREKAVAWHLILEALNRSFVLPFSTPNFGRITRS